MGITAEELVEHVPGLTAYARALTRDEDDAQDLLQDVLVKALERRDRFRGESSPATWLHTIMHHHFVDLARRSRAVPIAEDDLVREIDRAWREDSFTVDAQEVIARAELRDELRDALVRLPVILRSAVVLHDMLEMTTVQIAGIQGIGLPAAKQRLRRGRAALMRILASDAERRVEISVPLRCWEARSRIDDYLDRQLEEHDRQLLETHLEGCPTCPGLYAALVGVNDAVGRLRDPDSAVDPSLAARIRTAMASGDAGGTTEGALRVQLTSRSR